MGVNRWLLGITVLAVIVGTSQVAYGQAGVGVALNLNGGADLSVGLNANGSFTIQNTSAPTAVSEDVTNAFLVLIPGCKNQLAGAPCANNDAGVITVNSATSTGGVCLTDGITWGVVNNGDGSFNLTPSATITLPTNGSLCTVSFNFTVNSLPTADSRPTTPNILDTDSSVGPVIVEGSDASSAAATGTTHNAVVFNCSVQVDKQISCDGGTTWQDVGLVSNNEGGTLGCVGVVEANDIKVRYQAKNTSDSGINLSSCNITESNAVLGPGVGTNFSILNGVTTGILGETADALVCETTLAGGEPDTGAIDCLCDVPLETAIHVTASDLATFDCCGVAVDKQVQCNGGDWVDAANAAGDPLFNPPSDGMNSCSATFGQPVAIRYFAKNIGNVPLVCEADLQGLTDTQVVNSTVIFGPATVVGLGALNDQVGPIDNTNVTVCSQELNDAEASGNTATIACTCNGGDALGSNTSVTASDTAQIQCTGTPEFNISKSCTPVTESSAFDVAVTVNNTGDLQLSCDIVDEFFTGVCPVAGGAVAAGTVTVAPNPLVVSGGGTDSATGQFTPTETVCNQATVHCTANGEEFDNNTQTATAVCPVGQGCFTRTPGFWGNKLQYTQAVLAAVGNSLPSCGINLTNTAAGADNSTTEDLCKNDFDACTNNTSSQQASAIRACTAAALNLAVSALPDSELNCESAHPGITEIFNTCCVDNGICDSGLPGNNSELTNCIGLLDAFNNEFESTDFPPALQGLPTAADSTQCQAANGNGFMNPGRNLGPKQGNKKCQ